MNGEDGLADPGHLPVRVNAHTTQASVIADSTSTSRPTNDATSSGVGESLRSHVNAARYTDVD
jgi:hypothetical protein